MSKVRGSSQECQAVTAQEWPRRATPRLRSGAATRGDTPRPKPEARGKRREELLHAPKQEAKGGGGEEQPHDPGQGRWLGGPTPRRRSCGCTGAGGPRGAIPH